MPGVMVGTSFNGMEGFNNALPIVDGVAYAGISPFAAHADHVHPAAAIGSAAFNTINSGTNTHAVMVVGSGGSLTYSGSGSINASTLNGHPSSDFTILPTSALGWLHNDGVGGFAWSTPTKSDVGLSNVENTALSTWAGSANLTTLGTIASGIWSATKIALGYGGTGADLSATGGASKVLMQAALGAVITVAQLGASDLSNGVTGSGAIVLVSSPTLTGIPLSTTAAVNTNTTQIATTAFVVGQAGTANPLVNGTVAVGSSLLYSRQDHVHPTDTSRMAAFTTLGVTLGGTGTSTAFTQGSIIFAGVGGVYSQDNANFFYDPAGYVSGAHQEVGPSGANPDDAVLEIYAISLGDVTAHFHNNGVQGTQGGGIININSSPTGTPSAIASGNRLGVLQFGGTYDTTLAIHNGPTVGAKTTELWSATHAGSQLVFHTVANGSTTRTLALTLDQDQTAAFASTVTGTSFNSIVGLGSATPIVDGTGTAGTSTSVSRQDHVHPTDTSRQAAYAILSALGGLTNATGHLFNNGSGTLSWVAEYSLPTATSSILGGVKPDGTSILNTAGAISVTLASVGAQAALSGTGFVRISGTTISYDNSTYYLASNPSGYTSNLGTVTSVAALTLGTTGTDLSSTVANGTTTPVITLNVPTASATNRGVLSAADWSTFNGKQTAFTILSTLGGLTNATGYLYNNGSGTLSWGTPATVWGSITGSSAQASPSGGWSTAATFASSVTAPAFWVNLGGYLYLNNADNSATVSIKNNGGTGVSNLNINSSVSMNALTATTANLSDLYIGGFSGPSRGSLWKQATYGLALAGTTGSSYDMALLTPSAGVIAYNPTGTTNWVFNNAVSMGALTATTVSLTGTGASTFGTDALGQSWEQHAVAGYGDVIRVTRGGVYKWSLQDNGSGTGPLFNLPLIVSTPNSIWQVITAKSTATGSGAYINFQTPSTAGIGWDAGADGSSTDQFVIRHNASTQFAINSSNAASFYSNAVSMGALTATSIAFSSYSLAARGTVNANSSVCAWNGSTFGYGMSTNASGGLDIMANQAGLDIRFYAGTANNASPSAVVTFAGSLATFAVPISAGNIAASYSTVSSTTSAYGQLRVNNTSTGEASIGFSNNNAGPGTAGSSPGGTVWCLGIGVNGIGADFGIYNLAFGGNPLRIANTTGAATFASSVSMGALTATSGSFTGLVSTGNYRVATLPASPGGGARAYVVDATLTTFYTPVVGGGTNRVAVFYDDLLAAWRIG